MVHVLNWYQAQWALFLFWFWFVTTYHPRWQQGKPDALSCHSYFAPKEGVVVYDQQCDTIFKPENFRVQAFSVTLENKTFLQHICKDWINDYLATIVKSHWKSPLNNFDKFELHNGLLYHDELLYVSIGPAWLQIP